MEKYNKNGNIEKIFINEKISDDSSKIIIAENAKIIKLDDKYKITGTANGNGVNGGDFSVIISTALTLNSSCLYSSSCVIESGTAKVSPDGRNDRTIDYGDSLCDCNVDVIINGERFPIIIRD